MPATPWPTDDIPFKPIVGTWQEEREDNVLRTSNEVGPPKQRRRSYLPNDRITCDLVLTTAQKDALETFHSSTLVDGIASFSVSDPSITAAPTRTFKFVKPPGKVAVGIGAWRVSLSLRRLPE